MFRLRWFLAVAALAVPLQASAGNFDWIGHVELDAEALKSDDRSLRLTAVNQLANYDPALATPYPDGF